jgi:osmotically inducible protein OsmC
MKPAAGVDLAFSAGSRFEGKEGASPEDLLGAALAGCYSMALANALAKEDMAPESVETTAAVTLQPEEVGFGISQIELTTRVRAKGAEPVKFEHIARSTKETCPLAKALLGTTITLHASLV